MIFHLDWIASLFSISGMYIIGRKCWWGWIITLLNMSIYTYMNLHFHLYGLLPTTAITAVMCIKNAMQWRKQ